MCTIIITTQNTNIASQLQQIENGNQKYEKILIQRVSSHHLKCGRVEVLVFQLFRFANISYFSTDGMFILV